MPRTRFVDRLAPQAEWRLVHRVADASVPAVTQALHRAWWAPDEETTWTLVAARFAAGDAPGAAYAVDVEALAQRLQDEVWPLLYRAFLRSGEVTSRLSIERRLSKRTTIPPSAFRQTNPQATAWASRESARFVTRVTSATREAIRQFVVDAFVDQVPPRQLAKQLREIIGVTPQQAAALTRQRRQWKVDGLPAPTIQKRLEFATARALRDRTMNIARTETMAASNAGQVSAWGQARADGLLDPRLVKEWITTPDDRLCEQCEPLDGAQAPLDEEFPGGVQQPPLHPSCRCAVGLVAGSA